MRSHKTSRALRISLAALEDIIASKEWADRPKDHEALPELYAIRDAQAAAERARSCSPNPADGLAPLTPDSGRPGRRGYHLAVRVTSIADRLPSK